MKTKVIVPFVFIFLLTLSVRTAYGQPVLSGLDVLLSSPEYLELFKNKKVALITNQSGLTKQREKNYHALEKAGIRLVKIFAPEHGFKPDDTTLPIITLYGNKRYKPTAAELSDVDIIIFDIQDVGARFFTYASTMSYGMEAARENHKLFIVLDRPNPINGLTVRGKILEMKYATFVGRYSLPIQHGMTLGELALMFNKEFAINTQLKVIPVQGWQRNQWFDMTQLPWVPPSPSMKSLTTATHYPGTCYFEGTNLSLGRGTASPFEMVGAPWLNVDRILAKMSGSFEGVEFQAVQFTPENADDKKYNNQLNQGIFLKITDRNKYDPILVSLSLLSSIIQTHPQDFKWYPKHFDRLLGSASVRQSLMKGQSVEKVIQSWDEELNHFKSIRSRYLLY